MKSNEKAEFERTASDNNGSTQVIIPTEIANHLDLKVGDSIGLQTEYSDEHGEYASFWNKSKQEGEQQ